MRGWERRPLPQGPTGRGVQRQMRHPGRGKERAPQKRPPPPNATRVERKIEEEKEGVAEGWCHR